MACLRFAWRVALTLLALAGCSGESLRDRGAGSGGVGGAGGFTGFTGGVAGASTGGAAGYTFTDAGCGPNPDLACFGNCAKDPLLGLCGTDGTWHCISGTLPGGYWCTDGGPPTACPVHTLAQVVGLTAVIGNVSQIVYSPACAGMGPLLGQTITIADDGATTIPWQSAYEDGQGRCEVMVSHIQPDDGSGCGPWTVQGTVTLTP